jgi:hypothetical protein
MRQKTKLEFICSAGIRPGRYGRVRGVIRQVHTRDFYRTLDSPYGVDIVTGALTPGNTGHRRLKR